MKAILKSGFVLFVALLMVSCMKNSQPIIKGNGNVIIEKRDINGSFKSIESSSAIEVIIEQSNKTDVRVEADENLQNSITTKIKDGVLIISRKNGNFSSTHNPKVMVSNPDFEELAASSASTIKSKNTLKGDNLSLNSSSAAKIEAKVSFENVKINSSSASKIEIKGLALNLDANSSSASKINAEELLTNNVIAQASSGSKIIVHPIVNLKADASSGGKIEYNNTPKQLEKSSSSGGSIEEN